MRRSKSQLNAISRSCTQRANKKALERIKLKYDVTEDDIEDIKKKYNYKTNSYVVLEKVFARILGGEE